MKVTSKTRLQHKLNSALMFVLLIGLAIVLAWLSNRYEKQFDWTASGRHSLSSTSQELLKKIEGPIEITAYASDNHDLRNIIKDIIKRYQLIKPDINLHFINPVAVPEEVRSLGITVDGELVLRYQNRSEHVKTDSEEEFTNSLQRLVRGADRWLVFLEGHGERDSLGEANHDIGLWVSSLTKRGFKAQPLNLAEADTIPDNASVLILVSPLTDYLPGEVEKIVNYVRKGGNLFWSIEPGKLHGLEALADELQIEIRPGTVIDFVGQLLGVDDPSIAIASSANYQAHPALKGFSITSLFPALTPIFEIKNESWIFEPIIISGDHTWAETGELSGEVAYDKGQDEAGPLNILVSLSREVEQEDDEKISIKKQRIIVSGDGDFLSNQFLGNGGNLDLGMRLVNWLSNDDELISIPPNTADDLYLDLSDTSKFIIIIGFLVVLPLALLAAGLYIWWRRRKQ